MASANLSSVSAIRGAAVSRSAARSARSENRPRLAIHASWSELREKTVRVAAPVSAAATLLSAQAAEASDNSAILQKVDSFLEGASSVTNTVVDVGKKVYDVGNEVVKEATPYVSKASEVANPVVSKGAEAASKYGSPILDDVTKQAVQSLNEQGIDTGAVVSSAKQAAQLSSKAVDAATPVVKSSFDFITTTDPTVLVGGAAAAAVAYYIGGPVLGLLANVTRGYNGDISAPQALDILCTEGNSLLIDVRTDREKSSAGAPDLPGKASGKIVEVPFAVTPDRKLRGMLKSPENTEAQVTALQISCLKKLGGGTKVVILDNSGKQGTKVAKALASRGFGNVYCVADGFSGPSGWKNSKLMTKANRVVAGELFFGTTSSKKELPKVSASPVGLLGPGKK